MSEAVSFVVPVFNGERYLERVLDAILAQAEGREAEVLVIEDRSRDGSRQILDRYAAAGRITIVDGTGEGAAAAINLGIRRAQHELICQVDHDVILHPGWLDALLAALDAPDIAVVQGYYATDPSSSLWARVMGYDLEQRYARIPGDQVDHACTGTTLYRRSALLQVGLFDERFGYGYDNDLSYRLAAAGHRLVLCREARATHLWRDSCAAYLQQQYGIGYGRLDIVRKHGGRYRGDDAAGFWMILHAPLMLCVLLCLLLAGGLALAGVAHAWWPAAAGVTVLLMLAGERLWVGLDAARRFKDRACLMFPVAHLLRDLAWVAATLVWGARRLGGRPQRPRHSMPGRGPRAE